MHGSGKRAACTRAVGAAAAGVLIAAAPLPAQSADSVLARAQRAYDAMTTLRAEFTQTLINPMLGTPERSRGVLFLAPPGRFAMRFTDPAGDRIVADGKWLWIYTPSSVPNQVIRQPIPQAGANTPNLFAQFVDHPLQRYRAQSVGADTVGGEPVDVVRLTPRASGMPFTRADLAIAQSDGWPRRLSLVEPSGQHRVLVFERPAVNQGVPPAEVRFTVPKGTRVVSSLGG